MRPFNNMQVKLMLLFFLIALVPLCAVGAFSIRTAEELILKMANNQIEQVAVDKAALLEKWISERKADIQVLAGSSILRSVDPEQIAGYLDLVRNHYKVYGEISVVSREGNMIYNSSGREFSLEGEAWFKNLGPGELYMSEVGFDSEQKEAFFLISAPLKGVSGKMDRVVCATVGTSTILSSILQVSLGQTGECYLVDREGFFLAHKEPRRILTENIAQSESFKNIFNTNRQRITYIDYRGIEVLGASARVDGTGWALVVEQDRDEAFLSADRLKQYVYLVIALSILGALLSAWLLSRYVVGPIRKLGQAANHLAGGDFERGRIETHRKDEIGVLYGAFADMANQLRDRQHRLEEKVVLREAELVVTDSKLKETQQAAARSQQLASLGRLAAGVAHEIRTPLTSLKLFLESVENEIEISTEFQEDFHVAMKQIKRMEATITRFLDFARPQDPLLTTIDVKELIGEALLVVGPKGKQQETVIQMDIGPALPKIRGDKKQLGEVLVNLFVNGLEAMTHRGVLTIEARADRLAEDGRERECVRIDVKDTGPGIEKERIPRIFEPFHTTKATGTGLGLSIVYSTIRSHRGEIRVQSKKGEGTVFSAFFPVVADRNMEKNGKDTDR
jgi:two-component system, NtrC family, sensor kinase